jgi:hypothetical protein
MLATEAGRCDPSQVGDSEDETFWRAFLLSFKQRGLAGVQLVISDQHSGLVAALQRPGSQGRTGLGHGHASGVVAGGVGVLHQAFGPSPRRIIRMRWRAGR